MLTHEHDGRVALDFDRRTGAAVGVVLTVAMVALLAFFSARHAFDFLAVELGFIGGVYFGFAVAKGSVRELVLEFLVAGSFMLLGAVALSLDSPVLLAAGYLAHGAWDAGHHPRGITTPVRRWYPPFCAVIDVLLAAYILVRF